MVLAVCFLTACNSKQSSTAKGSDSSASTLERNKQVIMRSEDGFNTKDANVIVKDCAPDFVDYGDGVSKPMKKGMFFLSIFCQGLSFFCSKVGTSYKKKFFRVG